jgi:hypothetical protein
MSDNSTANYIFRVHEDGAANIRLEDWGLSGKLDANKIKSIKDVLKQGTSKIATSVPSPFARMHLFDTAFKMVSDDLDGRSVYHQLTSDCMDIFQLLFQSGNGNGDISYRIWNRAERIGVLGDKGAGHPHKLLADSLEMFFRGAFEGLQTITLIYYKGILIGGTSPLTVFFTSPNWQREMLENNIHIPSTTNHDAFFDSDFLPLHRRDPLFVEFMYRFYLAYRRTLHENCDGLAEYIRKTVETHWKELARKSNAEWSSYINNPAALDQDYRRVELLPGSFTFLQMGLTYAYTVRQEDIPAKIQSDSDFVIVPTVERYREETDTASGPQPPYKPLVLARGMNIAGTFTYDNTPWNPATEIRRSEILDTFGAPVPLTQRFLPGTRIRYPFLTTEDFLEDTLIRMPYRLHSEKFFTGYSGDFSYLLPVKKGYFNFFSIDDLKSALTILAGDTHVTVQLRIPVRNTKGNSHIIFTRDYDMERVAAVPCEAGLAIFPFYRLTDSDEHIRALNEYSVLFADGSKKAQAADLSFWALEDIIHRRKLDVPKPLPRSNQTAEGSSYHYKVAGAFDLIELRLKDERQQTCTGIILPMFRRVSNQQATKRYTFAIDFGTSNTHIAYLEDRNDNKPKTFSIGEADMQTVLLNAPGEGKSAAEKYANGFGQFVELRSFVNREAVPAIIGKEFGSSIAFPIRTATAEKATFQSETAALFQNISIGFFMDSDETKGQNAVYRTNLKWLFENALDSSDPDRIEAFLKELLLLIRNKVITTGGSLSDTRIAWLKPLSMKQASVDKFSAKWNAALKDVFKGVIPGLEPPITESIAPYFYLKSSPDANVRDFENALNIDIGGGTTDVMFFMRRSGKYLSTSFRFAGGDIWGSGYNRHEKDNGFIRNFLQARAESKKDLSEEDRILNKFLDDPGLSSEDVTSLLFRYDDHFRFSDTINRNKPQLKLIFFLHYSAIVYHLVQIMEEQELDIPRYFTFTGRGSQYLSLMCSAEALTKFTKLLLQAYTSRPVLKEFTVVLIANPKEATANGATLLVSGPKQNRINEDEIEELMHWGQEPGRNAAFRRNVTPLGDVARDREFLDSVLRNVQRFVSLTLQDEAIATFLAGYDIKALGSYVQLLTAGDATQGGELYDSFYSLLEGLRTAEGDGISETFFFLALKDVLYALSKQIIKH